MAGLPFSQLDGAGHLRHFLTTEGLSRETLTDILDTADSFAAVGKRAIKKVPLLRGKTVVNLFFEPSTRTLTTFELAAKRLSADVMNINLKRSAAVKGESLLDTLHTLEAMHCDMFVIRHASSGAAHFIARNVAPHISVMNGGDGRHAHPSQALIDVYTIRQHKPDFSKLRVAIVGDIAHSRVARSQIRTLRALGVKEVRIVAPRTLLPPMPEALGAKVFLSLEEGLRDVDVVMMLRLQQERIQGPLLPSLHEYNACYGLTEKKLAVAKADAIVMHPGPLNRGVEIDSEVADGPRSVILQQVSHGIAIRMAVMSMILGRRDAAKEPG